MKKLVLRPTYDSYLEMIADFLVSMGGIYGVYKEGEDIIVELDEALPEGEVVRRILDLGYELVLPHFPFSGKPGLDDRRVVKELETIPYVVATEYYPRSGRGVVVTVPGISKEVVEAALRKALGGSAAVEGVYLQPLRISFG